MICARLVSLVAALLLMPAVVSATDARRVIHITPNGDGRRDGSDWNNAAILAQLTTLLAHAEPNARVEIKADLGAYDVARPIAIRNGGSPGRPVVVTGVDGAGRPAPARIVGTRSSPYSPKAAPGSDVFRLLGGANHLRFENLAFVNQGNGCFSIGADIRDIAINNVTAHNVRRFIENFAARGAKSASVDGLVVTQTQVRGYSKGAIRLQYDSRNILLEDVIGDSEHQDGDDFAEGVALLGSVHDVVMRRVTMRNSRDTLHEYWNGDGFATEADTYRIRFEDTVGAGNTDAGYDIKSNDVQLVRAVAKDNKHNFKFWGRAIVLSDCIGRSPHRRGGTGVQDQMEIAQGADVAVTNCRFVDTDPSTTIFHVATGARLRVRNTTVSKNKDASMSMVAEGGLLTIE